MFSFLLFQLTVNSLWFDKDLSNATDTARVHHQLVPNELVYEPWLEQVRTTV